MRTLLASALALGALTTSANAQVITGRILDAAQQPVATALVTVLDGFGVPVRSGLSGADGSFSIATGKPGQFALRVERIGYQNINTRAFQVGADSALTLAITAATPRVALDEIRAETAASCIAAPEKVTALGTVWTEARKALRIAALVENAQVVELNGLRYARELDASARQQLHAFDQEGFSTRVLPYPKRPANLETRGFVVADSGNHPVYFAASADALAADAFTDTHCFTRIVTESRGSARVGLAFEPNAAATIAGVAGVIWLNASTNALQSIEYEYREPASTVPQSARGLLEFAILPNNIPQLVRWWIRLPIEREVMRGSAKAETLRTVREDGGLVLSADGTPFSDPDGLMAMLTPDYKLEPLLVEAHRITPGIAVGKFRSISPEELRTGARSNALDVVLLKRPQWLRQRGPARLSGAATPVIVYVDGMRWTGRQANADDELETMPAEEALRKIPAAWIASIQYYDSVEAPMIYGMGHDNGVIAITTVRR